MKKMAQNISWEIRGNGPDTHHQHSVSIKNMSVQMRDPNNEYVKTNQFKVNVQGEDTEWYLTVYPNGDCAETVNHVSIYLHLAEGNVPITAKYALHVEGKNGKATRSLVYTFAEFEGFGLEYFISHDELNIPELGYLENDTLNLHLDMCVLGKESSASGSSKLMAPGVDLQEDMSTTFNMEEFSDFVVQCGGKEFKCHKVTLACRSPVFKAMIMSNMKESKESKLIIDDFDEDTIEGLLRYIYSGKVASLDKQAKSLLAAAEKYDVAGLKAICEGNLAQRVNLDNAIDLLLLADTYNATGLKNYILTYVSGSGAAITQKQENVAKLVNNPGIMAELFSKSTL